MGNRFPSAHWHSMGIGGRIPPLLGVNDPRRTKEGRYLIAHAHEVTMDKRFPSTHWLPMGLGGAESAAPWVRAARRKNSRGETPNTVHFGHTVASQVSGRMPGPPVARAFCPPPFFAKSGSGGQSGQYWARRPLNGLARDAPATSRWLDFGESGGRHAVAALSCRRSDTRPGTGQPKMLEMESLKPRMWWR